MYIDLFKIKGNPAKKPPFSLNNFCSLPGFLETTPPVAPCDGADADRCDVLGLKGVTPETSAKWAIFMDCCLFLDGLHRCKKVMNN